VPSLGIRTTMIVGFPGETDQDFETLCRFVKNVEFDRLGVFLYSDEEGTAGFDLNSKGPPPNKQAKRRKLMILQAGISRKKNRNLVGRTTRLLVDGAGDRSATARLATQAPEIDGHVKIRNDGFVAGEFIKAVITGAGVYDLTARRVAE